MPILNPFKALRTLRKTPLLLQHALQGVGQQSAIARTDGPDGWSILFIVCHLRDYEAAFSKRVADMLAFDCPALAPWDQLALAEAHRYGEQQFDAVLANLQRMRRATLVVLEDLNEAQWRRAGVNPEQGEGTVLDVAISAGLHDIDHIEQILRCTARA